MASRYFAGDLQPYGTCPALDTGHSQQVLPSLPTNPLPMLRHLLRRPSPPPLPIAPLTLDGPWLCGLALSLHSDGEAHTPVGELLSRYKYAEERRWREVLASALVEALSLEPEFSRAQIVVHPPATVRRSFEPACELAMAVARRLRARGLPRLLAHTRRIASQKDLHTWEEKMANTRGAFRLRRPDLVKGQVVLAIDDVYDSGATLREVHRALTEAGAAGVLVATVTKTNFRVEE